MSPTELESIPTKVRESPWWGAWAPHEVRGQDLRGRRRRPHAGPGVWEAVEPFLRQVLGMGITVILIWDGGPCTAASLVRNGPTVASNRLFK